MVARKAHNLETWFESNDRNNKDSAIGWITSASFLTMIQETILPLFRIVLSGDDNMYGKPVAVKQVRPTTHVHPGFPAIGQITSMQWASTVHGRPFLRSLVTSVRVSGVLGY